MSKICQLTGKRVISGNRVSHSHIKTRRKFYPNLQNKKYYLPEEDCWIQVRLSTSAMKDINKKGLSKVLKEAEQKGLIIID